VSVATDQTQQVLTRLRVVVVDLAAARRHAQLVVLSAASPLVSSDVKQGRQQGTLLFAVKTHTMRLCKAVFAVVIFLR
jgi:hypothetical protein